jgi:hypothetical protein
MFIYDLKLQDKCNTCALSKHIGKYEVFLWEKKYIYIYIYIFSQGGGFGTKKII